MRLFKTSATAVILLTVLSIAACKKNGVSPASSQVSFQLQADNSVTTLASIPGSGLTTNSVTASIAGLTWTSGIANISRFKFEAKNHGTGTEIISKNLGNVDLFALSSSVANITVDSGTYKEIEIRVDLEHSTTDLLPLKLNGTFTNSTGTAIPIEFDLNDDITIKAEAHDVVISGTTDFSGLVHMHLNKLVTGVAGADLEAATLTNGAIIISKTSNVSIYNKILANLTSCSDSELADKHHKG